MIDIFYRRRNPHAEHMHPRVTVTTAPDAERAQHLIETLTGALDAEGTTPASGGRASRRRGTVAQLVKRRDDALDRELAALAVKASQPEHRVLSLFR